MSIHSAACYTRQKYPFPLELRLTWWRLHAISPVCSLKDMDRYSLFSPRVVLQAFGDLRQVEPLKKYTWFVYINVAISYLIVILYLLKKYILFFTIIKFLFFISLILLHIYLFFILLISFYFVAAQILIFTQLINFYFVFGKTFPHSYLIFILHEFRFFHTII